MDCLKCAWKWQEADVVDFALNVAIWMTHTNNPCSARNLKKIKIYKSLYLSVNVFSAEH